jgi:hypothetical protein
MVFDELDSLHQLPGATAAYPGDFDSLSALTAVRVLRIESVTEVYIRPTGVVRPTCRDLALNMAFGGASGVRIASGLSRAFEAGVLERLGLSAGGQEKEHPGGEPWSSVMDFHGERGRLGGRKRLLQ